MLFLVVFVIFTAIIYIDEYEIIRRTLPTDALDYAGPESQDPIYIISRSFTGIIFNISGSPLKMALENFGYAMSRV